MSESRVNVVTCLHCQKRLRVRMDQAGKQLRCPNPECGQAITIPLAVPPSAAPELRAPTKVPKVRQRAEAETADDRRAGRPSFWPWVVVAVSLLITLGALAGWATSGGKGTPTADRESLEARNQELLSENQKLRQQLAVLSTNAGTGKETQGGNTTEPIVPVVKPNDERTRFVGTWSIHDKDLTAEGSTIEFDFRTDGTCRFSFTVAGTTEEKSGTWKWDGGKLYFGTEDDKETKPVEVSWVGPDEFTTALESGKKVTLRRKGKPIETSTPAPARMLGRHDVWDVELVRLEFASLQPVNSCQLLGARPGEYLVVALRAKCVKETDIKPGLYAFPTFTVQEQTNPLPLRALSLKININNDQIAVAALQQGILGISKSGKRKVGDVEEFVAVLEITKEEATTIISKGVRLRVEGFIPGLPKLDLPVIVPGKLDQKP